MREKTNTRRRKKAVFRATFRCRLWTIADDREHGQRKLAIYMCTGQEYIPSWE
jgi:hypothetical protein